jgi:hypothetical protein
MNDFDELARAALRCQRGGCHDIYAKNEHDPFTRASEDPFLMRAASEMRGAQWAIDLDMFGGGSYGGALGGLAADHHAPVLTGPAIASMQAAIVASVPGDTWGERCLTPFPHGDRPPVLGEGQLRTASQDHADAQLLERFLDSTNPSSDTEMQQLIDRVGGTGSSCRMGPHERIKFLADHGMAPNLIPPRHRELMKTDIPDEAKDSLMKLEQDVHNPFELGHGDYNLDEYSVILDRLPDGMTPQEFLNAFLRSPNGAVDSAKFNFFNEFHAKQAGAREDWTGDEGGPGVGDWYHIDIPFNDGDVMLVDKDDDMDDGQISAMVQTMTDEGGLHYNDHHPVSGRRQFGIEELPDGGYRFYTRGFDRQTNAFMDNDMSRSSQHESWSSMMAGIAARHGGRSEHVDEEGKPVWGWHEHHSAEALLESGVLRQRLPQCEPRVKPD